MKKMKIRKQEIRPIFTTVKLEETEKLPSLSCTRLDKTTVEKVFHGAYQGIANIDFRISESIEIESTRA